MAYLTRFVIKRDINTLRLRNLGRFCQILIKKRTRANTRFTSQVNKAVSELQYFFKSGLHIHTCYVHLKEKPTPKANASIHLTHLTHLLETASHNRFTRDIAVKLKNFGTEVCRLQRQLYFYSDNPNYCPD